MHTAAVSVAISLPNDHGCGGGGSGGGGGGGGGATYLFQRDWYSQSLGSMF